MSMSLEAEESALLAVEYLFELCCLLGQRCAPQTFVRFSGGPKLENGSYGELATNITRMTQHNNTYSTMILHYNPL